MADYCAVISIRFPAHPGRAGRVLDDDWRPPRTREVVSSPKVLLASTSLAERSETLAGELGNQGNLAVTPVTLKLEMPMSSHMLCFLAFDGSHG